MARRIRSGKLVKLPLASASRTASISNLGGLRIADNRLNPGLGVRSGVVPPGCSELAELYAPNISLAFGSESLSGMGAGVRLSVVIAFAAVVTSVSEDEVDLSMKPVPLASGESVLPGIGQRVSRWPLLSLEAVIVAVVTAAAGTAASTPILSSLDFGWEFGIGCVSILSELFVVIIEGFALFPRLALRIRPVSSLSLDSLDSRPSSITSCPKPRSLSSYLSS